MLFLTDDYVLAKKKPKMYRVLKGCYEMGKQYPGANELIDITEKYLAEENPTTIEGEIIVYSWKNLIEAYLEEVRIL